MPFQNRVTPFNEMLALPERGTLTGNRGILHDASGNILRPYAHKCWVTCALSFRGRYRPVMTPGRYTHLFFLDEATALAAGHRPCAECRRGDYQEFLRAFAKGLGVSSESLKKGGLDRILQPERVAGRGQARYKPTHQSTFEALPSGAMFMVSASPKKAYLKWGPEAFPWQMQGYGSPEMFPPKSRVSVLTPFSTTTALFSGYKPIIHPSIVSKIRA